MSIVFVAEEQSLFWVWATNLRLFIQGYFAVLDGFDGSVEMCLNL